MFYTNHPRIGLENDVTDPFMEETKVPDSSRIKTCFERGGERGESQPRLRHLPLEALSEDISTNLYNLTAD